MSREDIEREKKKQMSRWVLWGILGSLCLIIVGMAGCPIYNVWERGLSGESELKRAEWNRQIKIREAAATDEAATHLANAEVKRAEGVAKANAIIGQSLKDNEA